MGEVEVICSTWLILKMTRVQMVLVLIPIIDLVINLIIICIDVVFSFVFCCSAWDYSAWVRSYALFLEERLECFRVLKYDIEADRPVRL